MPLVVIYDANVLYPSTLRDVLIRVGLARLVQPKWTDQILDEMFSALRVNRPDLDTGHLERTRELMNASIRDVMVRGYGHRVQALTLPDPDDRHVLAAAIHVEARVIVTKNPDALGDVVRTVARVWDGGDATTDQVIDRLAVDAPGAAELIRSSLHRPRDSSD